MRSRTIAAKLLVTSRTAVSLSHPDRVGLIAPLPEGASLAGSLDAAMVGLVFADSAAALSAVLEANRTALTQPGALWVLYPKANRIDVNRDTLWPMLSAYGMRPIAQVAIDEVWSALRFRALNAGEGPFHRDR